LKKKIKQASKGSDRLNVDIEKQVWYIFHKKIDPALTIIIFKEGEIKDLQERLESTRLELKKFESERLLVYDAFLILNFW
jgi:hypothetical protein